MNAIDNVEMIKKMKKLIETLNHASDAYYNSTPIMDDKEWDSLYCELQNLESESGVLTLIHLHKMLDIKSLIRLKK